MTTSNTYSLILISINQVVFTGTYSQCKQYIINSMLCGSQFDMVNTNRIK